jgi:hypothetical protein
MRPRNPGDGSWRAAWLKQEYNLVSHLPEDLYEENYFSHVRTRVMSQIEEMFTKVLPFTGSFLDGLDYRETIRRWPTERRIYVREAQPLRDKIHATVFIFDADDAGDRERYPNRTIWMAEHEHESDLVLYSTPPGEHLVGPGISRVELGGLVTFFPPPGIPNVWSPQYAHVLPHDRKDHSLIATAILFAREGLIPVVAATRPAPYLYDLAKRHKKRLFYVPLSQFNPRSVRSLRNLHMIAGHERRKIADRYIPRKR